MEPIQVNLQFKDRQITMAFDPTSPVHRSILGELQSVGAYEKESQFLVMSALRPGDTFVDIGAHIGYFTLLGAALVGDAGKVIAVEPVDENFRQLEKHLTSNGLDMVTAVQAVVSAENGERSIFFNADNDGGHALWDPAEHPANALTRENPRADTVASVTLDRLFKQNGIDTVRLMKIDTEGAEAEIIDGAREVFLSGRIEFVIMEVNAGGLNLMDSGIKQLFDLANDLGYQIFLPHPEGGPPIPMTDANRPDPRYVYNVVMTKPESIATAWR